ncbi:MAG: hypothetical protein K1X79_07290 [Oligoflexia bacterium]|nr:hypothetical protein [Oligoflexia bacterium]
MSPQVSIDTTTPDPNFRLAAARAEVLKEAERGHGSRFGHAVEQYLQLVESRENALVLVKGLFDQLQGERVREQAANRIFVESTALPLQLFAARHLLEEGRPEHLLRIAEHFRDRVDRVLKAFIPEVEHGLGESVGRERAGWLKSHATLTKLGFQLTPCNDSFGPTRAKQFADDVQVLLSGRSVDEAELSNRLVAVALHADRPTWQQVSRVFKDAAAGQSQAVLLAIGEEARAVLEHLAGSAKEQRLNKEADLYQIGWKKVHELVKSFAAFKNEAEPAALTPPQPSNHERLAGILALACENWGEHHALVVDLAVRLRDDANQIILLAMTVAADLGGEVGTSATRSLLEALREWTSPARIELIRSFALRADREATGALNELLELAVGKAGMLGRSAANRAAALDAFWSVGDPSPLFARANEIELFQVFDAKSPLKGGAFRSKEQVKEFVAQNVLSWPDRGDAFLVLKGLRWHGVLSRPPLGGKGAPLEKEFGELLQRSTLDDISSLPIPDHHAAGILIQLTCAKGTSTELKTAIAQRLAQSMAELKNDEQVRVRDLLAAYSHGFPEEIQPAYYEALRASGQKDLYVFGAVLLMAESNLSNSQDQRVLAEVAKGDGVIALLPDPEGRRKELGFRMLAELNSGELGPSLAQLEASVRSKWARTPAVRGLWFEAIAEVRQRMQA